MQPQNLSLFHLVRPPQSSAGSPPLLLLLHGFGSNEQDLFGLAPLVDGRFLVLSARGPNVIGRNSFAWFQVNFQPGGRNTINQQQAEESLERLTRFIDEAVKAYGADPKQVYLMGFSQGAIMSASIVLTRPELVAGAVLMSGRVLSEILPRMVTPEELQGLPILVVHGLNDQVLPIDHGRNTRQIFEKLPVDLTYREYPMGHEISRESLTDILEWLSGRMQDNREESL